MYAVERQRWIVERARTDGRVEVAGIARSLDVALETARRDLSVLERRGLLQRVHGGAIPVARIGSEDVLADRARRQRAEKEAIGTAALALVADADAVYLDEGSTARAFAELWHPTRAVTVVTNALDTASLLAARAHCSVIVLGGRVRAATTATVEHWAERMLADLVVDVALLGANGVTAQHAFTCPNPPVAAVKSAAVRAARTRVVLADHTKVGVDSLVAFASWNDVEVLVTDTGTPVDAVDKITALGTEVVRAPASALPG